MEIRKTRFWGVRLILRGACWLILGQKLLRDRWHSRRPQGPPERIALFASMELLGGGVMISAIVKTVRQLYPGSTIYLVGERHRTGKLESFFKTHSWVDEVIFCPLREGGTLREWWTFYLFLKQLKIDMCLLSPNHSCSNSVFLYLCGVPEIVGAYLPVTWGWHRNVENRFLTRRMTIEQMGVEPYRQLDFPRGYARLLTGRNDFRLAELVPYLRPNPMGTQPVALQEPVVTLYPGGGPNKRWKPDSFVAVGRQLVDACCAAIVIIGGPLEAEVGAEVRQGILDAFPEARVLNCCGAPVNDTLTYISTSALFVGNNGGPMQLAVAMGVPVIGIFQENDAWFCGPDAAGSSHCTVARDRVEDIPVGEVWSRVDAYLRRAPTTAGWKNCCGDQRPPISVCESGP